MVEFFFVGVLFGDFDGNVLYVNDVWYCFIFGYEKDGLLMLNVLFGFVVFEDRFKIM